MSNFKMDDYVPVNERIEAFYARWPDGTLQSEIVELTPDRVTVKAYAYREPGDALPGIGHSSLEIPGSTSFTRGSEIENAETSAWGRAIAALGFEVKRGVSSREEVRNKQPQDGERGVGARTRPATTRPAAQRTPEEQAILDYILAVPGMTHARMSLLADAVGVKKGERATEEQLAAMVALIEQPDGVPTVPAGGGDGSSALPAADTSQSEGSPSEGSDATTPAEALPPSQSAAPNDLMDDILAITGGIEQRDGSNITLRMSPPSKPGTAEYKGYTAQQKVEARAYWQLNPEPEEVRA